MKLIFAFVGFFVSLVIGGDLNKLRLRLKHDSESGDSFSKIPSNQIIFSIPHKPARRIVFLHLKSVGSSVIFQIFNRYVNESKSSVSRESLESPNLERYDVVFKDPYVRNVKSSNPGANTIYMTILRDPYLRAASLFYRAAREIFPDSQGLSWHRTDDDTSSGRHVKLAQLFIKQDPQILQRFPRLRLISQWRCFGDSPKEADSFVRLKSMLLGFTDRMDELLVMARHRFGWTDIRSIIYTKIPSSTPHHAKSYFDHRLLDEIPDMPNEQEYYSYARRYYFELIRSFGMARLEKEAADFHLLQEKLQNDCTSVAREESPTFKSVGLKPVQLTSFRKLSESEILDFESPFLKNEDWIHLSDVENSFQGTLAIQTSQTAPNFGDAHQQLDGGWVVKKKKRWKQRHHNRTSPGTFARTPSVAVQQTEKCDSNCERSGSLGIEGITKCMLQKYDNCLRQSRSSSHSHLKSMGTSLCTISAINSR